MPGVHSAAPIRPPRSLSVILFRILSSDANSLPTPSWSRYSQPELPMRIPVGFLIFLAAAPPAANAQDRPAAADTRVMADSSFYPRLVARFWPHSDAGSRWQTGLTAFARMLGRECPVVGRMGGDDLLYPIGSIDSLQVDYRQVPASASLDSAYASPDHAWHTLDLTAIKAKFKGC